MKKVLKIFCILLMTLCFVPSLLSAKIGTAPVVKQAPTEEQVPQGQAVVQKAIDFKLVDHDGNIRLLSEITGDKPFILHFWSHSCIYCWMNGLNLNAFSKDHPEIKIVSVPLVYYVELSDGAKTIYKQGYNFPIYMFVDSESIRETVKAYNFEKVPYVVIVKGDKTIVFSENAFKDPKQWEETINKVLPGVLK